MVSVKIWSDFACFTRPENKVERVSYDVMTPSAARGVLEGIFWKPEMRYRIREIWVLNPIRRFSLVRNEVKSVARATAAQSWNENGGGFLADEDRTQRHALILRDVAYVIKAEIELTPRATDPIQKYLEIFERRVAKGQAHRMPYLGNREFSAAFGPIDGTETPILETNELGRMLFDLEFSAQKKGGIKFKQHTANGSAVVDGVATPTFFRAKLERGVLRIPAELYKNGGS
jgi:CRISPR-associated protein Cas5d